MSFINRVNEPPEEYRPTTPPLPSHIIPKRLRLRQNITYGLYREVDDPYYMWYLHQRMELPAGTVLNVNHDTEMNTIWIKSIWINGVRQNFDPVRYRMVELSVLQFFDPENRRFISAGLYMTPWNLQKYEELDIADRFANLRI